MRHIHIKRVYGFRSSFKSKLQLIFFPQIGKVVSLMSFFIYPTLGHMYITILHMSNVCRKIAELFNMFV